MINPDIIKKFAGEECKPRVLVVTDMWFSKENAIFQGFSLYQFVNTLLKAGIEVTRANLVPYSGEPEGTLLGFKFDDQDNGLSREKYDVCFIFASDFSPNFPNLPDLSQEELAAIEKFMDEGGGVFATGDHEDLGARTCKDIHRVRGMRKWLWDSDDPDNFNNAPSISGVNRHSTILPGDEEVYHFDDQSDRHLQRLFLNRRTYAGGRQDNSIPEQPMLPHPLMQAPDNKAIVHIPDHPHEGECVIPGNAELEDKNEWPLEIGSSNKQIVPEIVAKSMSHGGYLHDIMAKEPLVPREFIAIAAYDGHSAGVGRVVTDATWHHFIDINIDGTGSIDPDTGLPRTALILGDDEKLKLGEREVKRIAQQWDRLQQHWRNLAEWLMPPQGRRRHAAVVHIADAVKSIPLDVLISLPADSLDDLGRRIKTNLDSKLLPYQVNDLVETVLAMGISDPVKRKTARDANNQIQLVALGALAAALSELEEGTVEEMLAKLEEAVAAAVESV